MVFVEEVSSSRNNEKMCLLLLVLKGSLERISFAKVNALSGSFKESDEDLHQICWVVQHSLNSTGQAFF